MYLWLSEAIADVSFKSFKDIQTKNLNRDRIVLVHLNPFVPNVPFLYPLKMSVRLHSEQIG